MLLERQVILAAVIVAQVLLEVNNNLLWRYKSMPITANIEIRDSAKKNGVKLWMVAEALGMADSAFSKKLRHELAVDERERVLSVIDQLAAGNVEVV